MYVRNYTQGIDLSWQEVFQTDSRKVVEEYCQQNKIEYEWDISELHLRTRQLCQATITHPQTNEKIWFNQAHLFHPSSLDLDEKRSLMQMLGEKYMPRNVFYGNDEPIEDKSLDVIKKVYEQEKIKFLWKRGDLMYLDNRLMAHSRGPYLGERKVAVAMGL